MLFIVIIVISCLFPILLIGIGDYQINNEIDELLLTERKIYQNYTIDSGFNNTQASWENVSIPSNSSITTDVLGYYKGFSSWCYDNISEGTLLRDASLTRWDEMIYTSNYVEFLDNYKSRNDVLHLHDQTTTYAVPRYSFNSSKSSGIFEVWVYKQEINKKLWLDIFAISNVLARVYFMNDGTIGYQDNTGSHSTGISYYAETWYNVKLEWYSNYTYRIYFENVWYGLYSFVSSVTPDNFRIYTDPNENMDCYVDSIDFSFENNYYFNKIAELLDRDAYYVSNEIDFGFDVNVTSVNIITSKPENTSLQVHVANNSPSFNNWVNYSEYTHQNLQIVKFKVLLNQTNAILTPILYNITFSIELYLIKSLMLKNEWGMTSNFKSGDNLTWVLTCNENISTAVLGITADGGTEQNFSMTITSNGNESTYSRVFYAERHYSYMIYCNDSINGYWETISGNFWIGNPDYNLIITNPSENLIDVYLWQEEMFIGDEFENTYNVSLWDYIVILGEYKRSINYEGLVYVSQANPTSNFYGYTPLLGFQSPTKEYKIFFNISKEQIEYPYNQTLIYGDVAQILLSIGINAELTQFHNLSIWNVSSSWDPTTITWNTQPTLDTCLGWFDFKSKQDLRKYLETGQSSWSDGGINIDNISICDLSWNCLNGHGFCIKDEHSNNTEAFYLNTGWSFSTVMRENLTNFNETGIVQISIPDEEKGCAFVSELSLLSDTYLLQNDRVEMKYTLASDLDDLNELLYKFILAIGLTDSSIIIPFNYRQILSYEYIPSPLGTNHVVYTLNTSKNHPINSLYFESIVADGTCNLTIDSLKIIKPISEHYVIFGEGFEQDYLELGDYKYSIYESGQLREEGNITITDNTILNYYITDKQEIRITFFNQESMVIPFETFHVKLNYTCGFVNAFKSIYSETQFIDKYSTYIVFVYDKFDNYILNQTFQGDIFADIQINLYKLKIYNQKPENFIHINITQDSAYWSEWLSPGEVTKFDLIPGMYNVTTTLMNGSSNSRSLTVNNDDVLLIADGLYLYSDFITQVAFKSFLNFTNIESLELTGQVTRFTNNYETRSVVIALMYMGQVEQRSLAPGTSLSLLMPRGVYDIEVKNTNGVLLSSISDVNLTDTYNEVVIGYYDLEFPEEAPVTVNFSLIIIIIVITTTIGILTLFVLNVRKKKKEEEISATLASKYGSKKSY